MIKNNYIHHNQIGIRLEQKAYIYFNAIYDNEYGIEIGHNDGMDSMISYNLIENNQKYAIYTTGEFSNTLSAINNYWGSDLGPEKDINNPSLITFEPIDSQYSSNLIPISCDIWLRQLIPLFQHLKI